MKRVLFLISHLRSGYAEQLRILVASLPRDRFQPLVCVLGRDDGIAGLGSDTLTSFLNWTRAFDLNSVKRLRQLCERFCPDIVHTWDCRSLHAGLTALRLPRPVIHERTRVIASHALALPAKRRSLAWPERWLLRRPDLFIVNGTWEATVYRALAIPDSKVRVMAPAIHANRDDPDAGRSLSRGFFPSTYRREGQAGGDRPSSVPPFLGVPANAATERLETMLPPGACFLVCVGEIVPEDNLRAVIWAFDILQCAHHDLHLVVGGDGPNRLPLRQFARDIRVDQRVHFIDRPAMLEPLLARAAAVVVPGRSSWALQSTLAGMAAGRPVVAFRHPSLEDLVVHEQTGQLAAPGEIATLARQIHIVLENPELGQRLGAAGRVRVQQHFAPGDMAQHIAQLYEQSASLARAA